MSDRKLHFDKERVRADIARLLQDFPELEHDADLRADTIEGSTDLHGVLERFVVSIRQAETFSDAIGRRIGPLETRRRNLNTAADKMRETIKWLLEEAFLGSVPLAEATISIRNTPRGVTITDEAALPEQFVKVTRTPRLKDIGDVLRAGGEVPGARLNNGGRSVNIRVV